MDNDRKINDRTYVKLHGSVSDGVTLSYTLEHYDELKERNTALIQAFANKPLLILGYSGFDTDVYPALKAVADSIPQIVIVKHPGSNPSQPIFELASSHSSAYILEAPCNEVLNILTRNLKGQGYQKIKARRKESQSIINKEAAKMLPMQYCPFALMLAFELVGNWEMVRRYGWLSHDAFDDTRYQGQLPPDLEHKLYMHIAYDLKLAGDENGRKIMLACADSLLNKSGGKLSDAMRAKWNEAYSHKAPNQSSLTNTATRSEDSPSDTLAAIVALNNLISDTSMDGHGNFLNYWQLGVARYRDGKFNESIDAFNIGCELLNKNASTHLESGRFLLDYGTALFEYSLELFKLSKLNEAAENRENSNISFELSEKITRENEDWVTNARVNLMLGKLLLSAEQFERSRSSVDKALESVLKTNDVALQHRINAFSDKLNDLMREMSA
jgi:tetratricopeptide (TPR) repeat protein